MFRYAERKDGEQFHCIVRVANNMNSTQPGTYQLMARSISLKSCRYIGYSTGC